MVSNDAEWTTTDILSVWTWYFSHSLSFVENFVKLVCFPKCLPNNMNNEIC